MLDLRTIAWCHARVPVYYWPVLWYWLGRLADTYEVYAEEGRRFFRWHLERDGRIWVEYCDESDEERRVRGALHPDRDRTPWTRLETGFERVFFARLARAAHCTATTPSLHRGCTLAGLARAIRFLARTRLAHTPHPGLTCTACLHPP